MRAYFLLLAFLAAPAAAQDPADLPFSLDLVETSVTGMPGLHSFAWAEHEGRWLFITGRVDGLHGIIESGAFAADQANDAVWVVDFAADQVWSRSLDELDDAIADPLKVTNPQYEQDGETLLIVGGYGTDSASGEKITFPTLTSINVPGLIGAVVDGGPLTPHLSQTTDERFAVTGGELRAYQDEYVLFGGHRFDGEYSPGGSGSFTQAYTEKIFGFRLDESTFELTERYSLDDAEALHRRDLTVAPTYFRQMFLGGPAVIETYAMYGGVFQPSANLPLRNPVFLAYSDIPEFQVSPFEQRFAHYTAPALPIFDAETSTMHTAFFGGMAQFYFDEDEGEVVEDFLVPFTDDIVTLTHEVVEDGATYETVMPLQMPGLLGTNAVLIPTGNVPRSDLGIVQLGETEGRTLVGYIVGGIESTMPNPGWMGMTAAETSASTRIFAVYLTRFTSTTEPTSTPATLTLEAPYPNPFRTEATVALVLDRAAAVTVDVFDVLGRRVAQLHDGPLAAARHTFTLRGDGLPPGVYVVRASGDGFRATQSLVRVR